MNSKFRNLLAFLLLTVFAAVFAFGQAETGQVSGTVTDPSGAVLSNAKVTLTNNGTGQTRVTQTNASGAYTFTNLQPGNYTVAIEGPGFTPFKGNVDVTVGGRHSLDAKLAVGGGGTTTVEVTAEGGAQVNTTDQQLSSVVNQAQIQQLPTLTRNPYSLVTTAGNVSETDPSARGVGVAINGQRAASTDVLLDGGENVDIFRASVGQAVPLDAVQEFRVITSNYTAEYGRASGGVVNVATRSGTNEYHGSLYEFNRISALASRTYDQSANNFALQQAGSPIKPQPRFVRNQFGYAVGGPVLPALRNKLFFFSSTEWTRVRSSSLNNALILTPQILASSAVSPATKAFFSTFGKLGPTTTAIGAPLTASQLGFSSTNNPNTLAALGASFPILQKVTYSVPNNSGGGRPQDTYSTLNRIDFNLTDKTSLFGRYGLESINQFPGTISFSPFAGYNTAEKIYNQNVLVNLTHLFSPTVVSQSKAVYNRLNDFQPLGTNPIGPTLYLTPTGSSNSYNSVNVAFPGYLPFNQGSGIPFGGPQNLYQFFEDLSWTRGNHQLRFGGQYIHARDNRVFGAYETAVEDVGSAKADAFDNLLKGQLFQFQSAVNPQGKFPCPLDSGGNQLVSAACTLTLPVGQPKFGRNNRYNDGAVYAQDTWKATPKLTLNLGVRWEYYGIQHNADPNLDSNFYFGTGATRFDQIRNGSVILAPKSPKGDLWKPHYTNFAPRVGFAFDPFGNGKWAVRGGYGLSYERNFGNVTFNVIQNPPNYAVISLQATDVGGAQNLPVTTNNVGPLAGTGQKALPITSLRAVDPDIKQAYAHQYSFAVEHELLKNTLMAVEYSGSRGIHQYSIANLNKSGFGSIYLRDGRAANRLNYQYGNINFRGSDGDSYYNGVNIKLQSSNFRDYGLQFGANYTYSHAIDDLSSTFSEAFNNFNLGYLDPFNPSFDRGNADFDIRHRITFNAFYEPTFLAFRNSSKLVRTILGGFQFAPIFTARTGTPFSIYDTRGSSGQSFARVRTALTGFKTSGGDPVPIDINAFNYLTIPTPGSYRDPIRSRSDLPTCLPSVGCTLNPPGSVPMTGRNAFLGPNNWSLDLGIYKTMKFTERVNLQLRGEFFNVLNHHNFYVVGNDADFASNPFVQAIKGRPDLNDPSKDERRNVQLGLKINF